MLVYKGITELWETCLCPKQEGALWYGKACLMGECPTCGVEKFLPLCAAEKEGNTLVQWKCFDKQVIGTIPETGEVRKRIREVFMETSVAEFIAYLKPNLQKFIRHNFVASGKISKRGWHWSLYLQEPSSHTLILQRITLSRCKTRSKAPITTPTR